MTNMQRLDLEFEPYRLNHSLFRIKVLITEVALVAGPR